MTEPKWKHEAYMKLPLCRFCEDHDWLFRYFDYIDEQEVRRSKDKNNYLHEKLIIVLNQEIFQFLVEGCERHRACKLRRMKTIFTAPVHNMLIHITKRLRYFDLDFIPH